MNSKPESRWLLPLIAVMLAGALAGFTPAASTSAAPAPPQGEAKGVMVMARPAASTARVATSVAGQLTRESHTVTRQHSNGITVVEATPGQESAVAADIMAKNPGLIAEPNYAVRVLGQRASDQQVAGGGTKPPPSNDPYLSNQWGLQDIGAPCAWQNIRITPTSKKVVVAVIDTGAPSNHPDVFVNSNDVYNLSYSYDGWDRYGHGTHVMGIIAGFRGNGVGIAGVTNNVRLISIKGLDDYGYGYYDQLAAAVALADQKGAQIINASWGGYYPSQILEYSIRAFQARGGVFVAARGNGYDTTAFYPAAYADVAAVATQGDGSMAYFTSRGGSNTLAAPGYSILSTVSYWYGGWGYESWSGTSMAAPHFTGSIAGVMGRNTPLTPKQALAQVRKTTADLGPQGEDNVYGPALLDYCKAAGGWRKDRTS